MNLYILRHGLAVECGTPGYKKDSDRPLTAKGKRRMWQIAEAMEAMELNFDMILSSPFLRARQTAEIVAETFELRKKLALTEALTPDGNPKLLVEQLNKLKVKDILLVGHEPYLSQLIGLLVSGNTNMALDFKKGGLGKLEAETLRCGRCATLAWLLTPRQMMLMA
ncbi:MAG: phosphohistidine phosphatase SixA [Verrucomicrobiota bacterium]